MTVSDPAIALLVGLGVLIVFVGVVLGSRRFPRGREQMATETWRRTMESRLEHFEADMRKTKHDVGNVLMTMQSFATSRDVNDVKLQVATLTGEMKGMSQSLGTVQNGIGRIENFLMDAAAKRIAGVPQTGGADT